MNTPLLAALAGLRAQSALLPELLNEDKIMLPAGYNPGTWGAVLLAREILETKGLTVYNF